MDAERFWLVKSEPDEFSIADLRTKGTEPWTGVRNYQARNFMTQGMRVGDPVFFYHSNANPSALVGLARVHGAATPDPTQFLPSSPYFDPKAKPDAPRWFCVTFAFAEEFPRALPLETLKSVPALAEMTLLRRGNRLSVLPIEIRDARILLEMAGSSIKM